MNGNRRIATVTQLNNYIKALLDQTPVLRNVWIKGEISNLKLHSSGHIYLTLKDEGSVLRAVMFRSAAAGLAFRPENGMKVLAGGRVSVYERDGGYQLYIESMEAEGQGNLYVRFELLKKKLEAEGLFSSARKKPIPKFPKTVGICTSPTGAAVRDIINVLRRRYPLARAVLYPCLVQGEGASASVVDAIQYFNRTRSADVLIVGRGGGSIEDLWAFNEEATARAVAASEIPIISAVGHETDFTICDFVADMRAPTPSAAAELAVPELAAIDRQLGECRSRLDSRLKEKLNASKRTLELLSQRSGITGFRRRLGELQMNVDRLQDRMTAGYKNMLERNKRQLGIEAGRLNALSPLSVLERGYSVAMAGGRAVRRLEDVTTGDEIWTTVADGRIKSIVTDKEENADGNEI